MKHREGQTERDQDIYIYIERERESYKAYIYMGSSSVLVLVWGNQEVKTEIACSLSQSGLLCSTYILF